MFWKREKKTHITWTRFSLAHWWYVKSGRTRKRETKRNARNCPNITLHPFCTISHISFLVRAVVKSLIATMISRSVRMLDVVVFAAADVAVLCTIVDYVCVLSISQTLATFILLLRVSSSLLFFSVFRFGFSSFFSFRSFVSSLSHLRLFILKTCVWDGLCARIKCVCSSNPYIWLCK